MSAKDTLETYLQLEAYYIWKKKSSYNLNHYNHPIVQSFPSLNRGPQNPGMDMFCYSALLWQRNASTQRMLSQLVPNYSSSTHFHNTEQGLLYLLQ